MRRNPAGRIITAVFEDYRGYVIRSDKGRVTVGRMGHRQFASYPITTVEQARAVIDVWEDNADERNNLSIISRMAAVFSAAA